jgi:hypothetical protein
MPSRDKLSEFVAWCGKNITGDEKGQAQIFLDRLFQVLDQAGCLDVGDGRLYQTSNGMKLPTKPCDLEQRPFTDEPIRKFVPASND